VSTKSGYLLVFQSRFYGKIIPNSFIIHSIAFQIKSNRKHNQHTKNGLLYRQFGVQLGMLLRLGSLLLLLQSLAVHEELSGSASLLRPAPHLLGSRRRPHAHTR